MFHCPVENLHRAFLRNGLGISNKKLLHLLKDGRVFIMRIYKRLLIVENSIAYSCKHLFIISNFINELFGGCPAETGIGNGFTVNAFANLLAAVLYIAFNHQTLNQAVNICA